MVKLLLGNMTDEQAIARSRGGQGPSVAWLVGHMLHYRCLALNALGADKTSPYKEKFSDQGADDGAGYPSRAALIAEWDALAAEIDDVVGGADDEAFRRTVPGPGPHGEQQALESMTFFTWHEAYHMGAASAVCKDIGLPGIADLVMARMEKSELRARPRA